MGEFAVREQIRELVDGCGPQGHFFEKNLVELNRLYFHLRVATPATKRCNTSGAVPAVVALVFFGGDGRVGMLNIATQNGGVPLA